MGADTLPKKSCAESVFLNTYGLIPVLRFTRTEGITNTTKKYTTKNDMIYIFSNIAFNFEINYVGQT